MVGAWMAPQRAVLYFAIPFGILGIVGGVGVIYWGSRNPGKRQRE
jgi:hypothetical protein